VIAIVSDDLIVDPFTVTNTVGLVAFAFAGATKAIRERFGLFGITFVGLVTAFAGGTAHDILVDRVPLALSSPIEIGLGMVGLTLAVGVSVEADAADEHPLTLLADAVGLVAFATVGAIVAMEAGIPESGVVTIATINAVGGGAFADVLLNRPRLFSSTTSTRAVPSLAGACTGLFPSPPEAETSMRGCAPP
jgi:uncharacterized membrane protein YeiH